MEEVSEFLKSIVKDVNICALCLKEVEEGYHMQEELLTGDDGIVMKTSELVNFILNRDDDSSHIDLNSVCVKCITEAKSCYSFIERCRTSHLKFNTLLENLDNCITNKDYGRSAKSIYITVDNNLSSKVQVDRSRQPVNTLRKALNRLKLLTTKPTVTRNRMVSSLYSYLFPDPHSNVYLCKECPKRFERKQLLVMHYKRIHAPKVFKCRKCEREFAAIPLLNSHVNEYHKELVCTQCGKKYNRKQAFLEHVNSHTAKVCPKCGKHLLNPRSFKLHLKRDSCDPAKKLLNTSYPNKKLPVYKFECDMCGKLFTKKAMIAAHIHIVHGTAEPFACSVCGKQFLRKSAIKDHMIKHTRERLFHCELCGGKFVTRLALVYHTRLHTGEKPYPCPECDEYFISTSRRMEHLRRKHWEPEYGCDICEKRFHKSSCLKKHIETHSNPRGRMYRPQYKSTKKKTEIVIKSAVSKQL